MKVYRITGTFRMCGVAQPFSKEVLSKDKAEARERLYSDIGSKHRVKRRFITLDEITEVPPGEVQNLRIKQMIEG